jgi:hypothetical protein
MKNIQPKKDEIELIFYKIDSSLEDIGKSKIYHKTSNLNQEVVEALRRKIVENGDEYAWENCDNA